MNQIGLPLTAPSKQTILPVITDNCNVQGFLTIAATTFTGTETSFATSDGPISITTVTLPSKVRDNNYGVQQYMAAVYDDVPGRARPWLGYSSFVNTNDTGYQLSYVMATQGWFTRLNRGTLITNLLVSMNDITQVPPVNTPPVVQNGAIRWAASLPVNASQLSCGFFDFDWTTLFKAKSSNDPLSLTVVSNPVGGNFKSTLVPNPVIMPLGGVEFNTVRIIMLQEAVAGSYVFNYSVTDTKGGTTPVTLTLTLV